jgi:putative nucleotidyltransferase-like protein
MTTATSRPSRSDKLLLHAALGDPESAITSWRQWQRRGERIDVLHEDGERLLPQLYRNLLAAGYRDPDDQWLKGIYRYTLYRNQLLFHAAAPILRGLDEAGVSAMLLKGAAIAGLYPHGSGTRPISEVDILVRPTQVDQALEIFDAHGVGSPEPMLSRARRVLHSVPLRGPEGLGFELHWEALPSRGDDSGLWQAAHRGQLGGAPVLVPARADQLLHACLHGTGWSPAPMRWITDSMLVLRAADHPLDWAHAVSGARAYRASRTFARCLSLLVTEFEAEVPEWVLGELRSDRAPKMELIQEAVGRLPRQPMGMFWLVKLDRYLVQCRREGVRPTGTGYLDLVAASLDFENRGDIRKHLSRRAGLRARGLVTPIRLWASARKVTSAGPVTEPLDDGEPLTHVPT